MMDKLSFYASQGRVGRTDPTLICIPGLLGGAEDFRHMLEAWRKRFRVLVFDPNAAQREAGGLNISEEVMKEISYNTTAEQIRDLMDAAKVEAAYLVGVSLGGKIVYDFGAKFPERFLGGLITDVGPGPFEDSLLHQFVHRVVNAAPLHLSWPDMKDYLRTSIPDRSLRSLIQTQISYPKIGGPAVWKTAMKNFGALLERQEIGHQFDRLEAVDEALASQSKFFKVMQAQYISGIGLNALPRMRRLRCVNLIPVPNSSHFLHVTHKERIAYEVLDFLNPKRALSSDVKATLKPVQPPTVAEEHLRSLP